MKTVLIIAGCISSSFLVNAQNTIGVQNDLKTAGMHSLNVNTTAISTFGSGDVKGSRYLFLSWTPGSVTDQNNVIYSKEYTFNFDKIDHELYARYNLQGNISIIVDKSKVKRFTIGAENFINSSLINPKEPGLFYQVLVEDSSKISLYKLTKTKFVRANPSDMTNVKTGNFSSEFVDGITYYVLIGKDLSKINLTANNIRKVLKTQSEKVSSYYELNSSKDVDEEFLIELVKYLNS
jgi:hypothetical protein